MRIAYVVSDLTFPPREGLHEQTILTAKLITSLDVTVDLFGFVKDYKLLNEEELEKATGLTFCSPPIATKLPNLLLGLQNALLPKKEMRDLISTLSNYDVVHLENAGACGLVRKKTAHRTIVALIDPGSLRWRRMGEGVLSWRAKGAAWLQRSLHTLLERMVAKPGAIIQVVSATDASYLKEKLPGSLVEAVPISFAVSATLPNADYKKFNVAVFIDLRPEHTRKSFVWAAKHVLPSMVAILGSRATIDVFGRVEPDDELRAVVMELPVRFVAWVEDISTALRKADLVLIPDRIGTGLKNRVVQAMALGCPVAGTDVAFEGIPARDGIEAIVEVDGPTLGTRAAELIRSDRARSDMATAGLQFALDHYGLVANAYRWQRLYGRLLSSAPEDPVSTVTRDRSS